MSESGVTYTIAAVIDLLGFSQHLEVAGHDLRTNVGTEAVRRLQILADAINLVREERRTHPHYYPKGLFLVRINDAIIATADLPTVFTPAIGDAVKSGVTDEEIAAYFTEEELDLELDELVALYRSKVASQAADLTLFLGMVARIHKYVGRREAGIYQPGPRTIVATGFRRPLDLGEPLDSLSANFAFSNAYMADRTLRGAGLFVDEYALQLSAANVAARNVIQHSVDRRPSQSTPTLPDYVGDSGPEVPQRPLPPIEVELFRRRFFFRKINSSPLGFLQIVPALGPILDGTQEAHGSDVYSLALRIMKRPPSVSDGIISPSPLVFRMDLEDHISVVPDMLLTGRSEVAEKERRARDPQLFGYSPSILHGD